MWIYKGIKKSDTRPFLCPSGRTLCQKFLTRRTMLKCTAPYSSTFLKIFNFRVFSFIKRYSIRTPVLVWVNFWVLYSAFCIFWLWCAGFLDKFNEPFCARMAYMPDRGTPHRGTPHTATLRQIRQQRTRHIRQHYAIYGNITPYTATMKSCDSLSKCVRKCVEIQGICQRNVTHVYCGDKSINSTMCIKVSRNST